MNYVTFEHLVETTPYMKVLLLKLQEKHGIGNKEMVEFSPCGNKLILESGDEIWL